MMISLHFFLHLHTSTSPFPRHVATKACLATRMGLVRSLGLRDLDVVHLEALERHGRPLPELLQLDLAPWEARANGELLRWCAARGVALQATGLLHRGTEQVAELAWRKNATEAQVMLRWAQQRGFQRPGHETEGPLRCATWRGSW